MNKMQGLRILVFQLGARRHYAVAKGLFAHGALTMLVTDACAYTWPFTLCRGLERSGLNIAAVSSVLSRIPLGIEPQKVISLPWFFLRNALRERLGNRFDTAAERWASRNARFASTVARVSLDGVDTVYGYNAASLEVFSNSRKLNKMCVLDQSAAPWRFNTRLLQEELETWRGWESYPADVDRLEIMAKREEAEWRLANRIICGSQFVVDCVRAVGGPWEKCRVVKYPNQHRTGTLILESDLAKSVSHDGITGPVRLLFAGTLQLRKGIQHFYRMAEILGSRDFHWRAVGPSLLLPRAMEQLASRVEVLGRVPRNAMAQHYAWADAMVFPTLSEGSANVCLEALGMGKTVITTPAAGISAKDYPGLHVMKVEEMPEFLRGFRRMATASPASVPVRTVEDYGRDLLEALVS